MGLGWHVVDLRYLLYRSEAPDAYYAVVGRGREGGWVVEGLNAAADVLRPNYATLDEAKAAAMRAVDPEAAPPQVRIEIGKAYEVLQPGRREAAEEVAAGLRAAGLDVQLNVTKYVPGPQRARTDRGNGHLHRHHRCNDADHLPHGGLLPAGKRHAPSTAQARDRIGSRS